MGCVQVLSVVGILQDETDPMVSVMKVRQCVRMCAGQACTCCTHAGHVWYAHVASVCKCLREHMLLGMSQHWRSLSA